MKKIIYLIFLIIFIVLFFNIDYSIKTNTGIRFEKEFSIDSFDFKYNFQLKSNLYLKSKEKFITYNKNLEVQFIQNNNENYYLGKDFYLVKNDSEYNIYNKSTLKKQVIYLDKKCVTSKDSNILCFIDNSQLSLDIASYDYVSNQIEIIKSISFDNQISSIYFNNFILSISFYDNDIYYYDIAYDREYRIGDIQQIYLSNSTVASDDGEYIGFIGVSENQLVFFFDKKLDYPIMYKKQFIDLNPHIIYLTDNKYLIQDGDFAKILKITNTTVKVVSEKRINGNIGKSIKFNDSIIVQIGENGLLINNYSNDKILTIDFSIEIKDIQRLGKTSLFYIESPDRGYLFSKN